MTKNSTKFSLSVISFNNFNIVTTCYFPVLFIGTKFRFQGRIKVFLIYAPTSIKLTESNTMREFQF